MVVKLVRHVVAAKAAMLGFAALAAPTVTTALRQAECTDRKLIVKAMFAHPRRHLVSLIILLAISHTAHAQSLRAEFSPLANFAYQLDCVSGTIRQRGCAGADDFRALWKHDFGIDTATSPEVKRWAALRKDYAEISPDNRHSDAQWPHDGMSFSNRILIAAFAARDTSDYHSRLVLLLPDRLVQEANIIVQSLYPPFGKWWKATGASVGKPAADAMISALEAPAIKQQVVELFSFYGAPKAALPAHTAQLMLRPGLADKSLTSGSNFGSTSIVEFFAETKSCDQTPVIVHEYAHYVFGATPRTQALALSDAVKKAGSEIGMPMWGLLDEALATAIGNGRVSRTLMSEARYAEFAAKAQIGRASCRERV